MTLDDGDKIIMRWHLDHAERNSDAPPLSAQELSDLVYMHALSENRIDLETIKMEIAALSVADQRAAYAQIRPRFVLLRSVSSSTASSEGIDELYTDGILYLERDQTLDLYCVNIHRNYPKSGVFFSKATARGIVAALFTDLDMSPDDLHVVEFVAGESPCLRCHRRAATNDDSAAGNFCIDCIAAIQEQSVTAGGRRASIGDLAFDLTKLDIHVIRDHMMPRELHFNISQAIVYHSPDGFEIAFPGSGPADFALNIVALFVGKKRAMPMHQEFKRDFIQNMPDDGGIIEGRRIVQWIRTWERDNDV